MGVKRGRALPGGPGGTRLLPSFQQLRAWALKPQLLGLGAKEPDFWLHLCVPALLSPDSESTRSYGRSPWRPCEVGLLLLFFCSSFLKGGGGGGLVGCRRAPHRVCARDQCWGGADGRLYTAD